MRLIDADALLEKYNVKGTDIAECLTDAKMAKAFEKYCIIADAVEQTESVDAVEVVHGEWIIDGMNEYELSYGCVGYEPIYRCSKCGITTESYLRTERPIMPEDADFPNYCPYCGAKMDGEEQDDEQTI